MMNGEVWLFIHHSSFTIRKGMDDMIIPKSVVKRMMMVLLAGVICAYGWGAFHLTERLTVWQIFGRRALVKIEAGKIVELNYPNSVPPLNPVAQLHEFYRAYGQAVLPFDPQVNETLWRWKRQYHTRFIGANYGNRSRCDITTLPPEIGRLKNLRRLRIYGCRGLRLPPEIGELTQLETLSLSQNILHDLPSEIGNLTNLRYLYLNGIFRNPGGLTRLPPEIGRLQNLVELEVDRNSLEVLPPEIGQLKRLRRLDVSINHLEALPPEIGALSELEVLILNFNGLTELPPELTRLTNLRELYAAGVFRGRGGLRALPLGLGAVAALGDPELVQQPALRAAGGRWAVGALAEPQRGA